MDLTRFIEMMSRQEMKLPYWMMRYKKGSTVTKISKYEPHQGKKSASGDGSGWKGGLNNVTSA